MSQNLLKGKVAIVTGAARNMGSEFAKMMGAEGASVVIHYHSAKSKGEAEETANTIKKEGEMLLLRKLIFLK